MRRWTWLGALAAALLVAGCGAGAPAGSGGMGGSGGSVVASSSAGTAAGGATSSSTGSGGGGGEVAPCNVGGLPFCNPFGVDLEVPPLAGAAYWKVISETLRVPLYKPAPIDLAAGGACDRCEEAVQNGRRLVLGVRADGFPASPPADLSMYQALLGELLDAHQAAVVAIVVEEGADTPATWTGTTAQYLEQLAAACATAHEKGVGCTDGGLSSTTMILLLADYQVATGHTAGAVQVLTLAEDNPEVKGAFATWPPVTTEDVAAGLATQKPRLDAAKALLAGVRAAGVDYVNFHWYERDQDTLDQAMAYVRNETGCNALATSDLGQRTQDVYEALHKAGDARELGMSFVIWSSRAESGLAMLMDGTGKLTANGTALQTLSVKAICGD